MGFHDLRPMLRLSRSKSIAFLVVGLSMRAQSVAGNDSFSLQTTFGFRVNLLSLISFPSYLIDRLEES